MSSADLATFRRLAEDRLEKFNNKAERTAFLVGLSLGAREMGFDERQRTISDLMALWGIELENNSRSSARAKQAKTNAHLGCNPELAAKLAALRK